MKSLKYLLRVFKHLKKGEKLIHNNIYSSKEKVEQLSKIEPFPIKGNHNMSLGLITEIIKSDYPTIFNNYIISDERFLTIIPLDKYGNIDMHYYTKITRTDFIILANSAYKKGLISAEEYEKIKPIEEKCSLDSFKSTLKGQTLHYTNNRGTNVEVPLIPVIELLELSPEEFKEVLKTNPFGLCEDEFADFINIFNSQYNTFGKYFVSLETIDNNEYLRKNNDIYALNFSLLGEPDYASLITVDENLWNNILKKIPSDFNQLETAYYIYYELCKTFTYSEDFFVVSEQSHHNNYTKNFSWNQTPEALANLNEENNQLVCYEIMGIYQKFLKHLNIKYDVLTSRESGPDVPFTDHPTIRAFIDNMALEIDATLSVISGDMPLAKENKPLKGFTCQNNNEATKEKFSQSLAKVNKYIEETEKNEQSFYSVLDEYNKVKENDNQVSLSDTDKIDILLKSIEETTLSETDRLAHIMNLTEILFPDGNCTEYFVLENTAETELPKISTIFSYAPTANIPPVNRRYITYSTTSGKEEKTFSELLSAFKNHQYEYMRRYPKEISGISSVNQHK